MDIIAFFYFNNKKFIIALKNNNLIYCIREKEISRFELGKEEVEVFSEAVEAITPDLKKTFFVKTLKYNDVPYKLFFNPEKNLYYTDNIEKKIISYVNFNYNHVPDICCTENSKNKEENKRTELKDSYFKRAIKIGKKIILVSVLSTLSLSSLVSCSHISNENETNLSINVPETEEKRDPNYTGSIIIDRIQEEQAYDFSKIEEAIDSNENLTNQEKDFIKSMRFVFDENHQYMDIEMAITNLSKLQIKYDRERSGSLGGKYNTKDNKMTLYNATSFEDCYIANFVHEFLHAFQQPSNDFLKELSNEVYSREVVRRLFEEGKISKERLEGKTIVPIFGDGYDDYIPTFYVLSELIDEKTLRKYQFGCDTYTLIKGLSYSDKGIINQKQAHQFVANINSARVYNEETHMFELVDAEGIEDIQAKCYENLNYYYKLKKGNEIKDDLKVAINYYEVPTAGGLMVEKFNPYTSQEKEALENILKQRADVKNGEEAVFGAYRIVIPRTYFSDMHKNPTITFNSPKITTVEVTEKLEKEFKEEVKKIKENDTEISLE